MKDDRLRVPGDEEYFTAVVRATVAFARLEWDAIWCCERLKPGYINGAARKTAGTIANDLEKIAEAIGNTTLKAKVLPHAKRFKALTKVRNGLLHGKPGTVQPGGEQRLFRDGTPWTIEAVDDAADDFVEGADPLNALLKSELK